MYDEMPTSTAASPTKLCRMATSSGMPVISTRRARLDPTTVPPRTAPMRSIIPSCDVPFCAHEIAVTLIARAIPSIPNRLPLFAVSCFDRPPRLRMNRTPATR